MLEPPREVSVSVQELRPDPQAPEIARQLLPVPQRPQAPRLLQTPPIQPRTQVHPAVEIPGFPDRVSLHPPPLLKNQVWGQSVNLDRHRPEVPGQRPVRKTRESLNTGVHQESRIFGASLRLPTPAPFVPNPPYDQDSFPAAIRQALTLPERLQIPPRFLSTPTFHRGRNAKPHDGRNDRLVDCLTRYHPKRRMRDPMNVALSQSLRGENQLG